MRFDRTTPFWKDVAVSTAVVYAPFFGLVLYMLAFVSCSHCQKTAGLLFPCGPGWLFVDKLFQHALPLAAAFPLALGLSITIIVLLAWIGQLSRKTFLTGLVILFLVNCYQAIALHALIRA